jgi:hypothetical protein
MPEEHSAGNHTVAGLQSTYRGACARQACSFSHTAAAAATKKWQDGELNSAPAEARQQRTRRE